MVRALPVEQPRAERLHHPRAAESGHAHVGAARLLIIVAGRTTPTGPAWQIESQRVSIYAVFERSQIARDAAWQWAIGRTKCRRRDGAEDATRCAVGTTQVALLERDGRR